MDDDSSPATLGVPASPPTAPASRLPLLVPLIAVAVIVLDQVTKAWAVAVLTVGEPVDVLGSLLRLELVRNSGAAFSLATGMTWILTVIAAGAALVIVRISRKLGSTWWAVGLGLLLGGALGNLLDRLFRAPGLGVGHVVDFLVLPHWPVFNVADMCIDTAGVLIVVLVLRRIGIDGSRNRD
jgi:signal peptidase II